MIKIFEVLEPGAYTTVQDRGRLGFQQFGVPTSGAADEFSFRLANLLVGNGEDFAALELTVIGPKLRVLSDSDIAITGAEVPVYLNDRPMSGWSSFRAEVGDIVRIKMAKAGCRSYLAVRGGIEVPPVMGSRSTYVGAQLGGFAGRPMRAGDIICRGDADKLVSERRIPPHLIPEYPRGIILRAMAGPQDYDFDEGLKVFFKSTFLIGSKSDRMGYRLEGPAIKRREGSPSSIISEASLPGGVQVPPDGQPIIVLSEQTAGGYSKIASVISVDLPRVAQGKPGDWICFEFVDLEVAHKLYHDRENLIKRLKEIISV